MIHGISPFSIYNPPAVREIHPADIPAASPEPVACFAPYGAGTALRSLGAASSPVCGWADR